MPRESIYDGDLGDAQSARDMTSVAAVTAETRSVGIKSGRSSRTSRSRTREEEAQRTDGVVMHANHPFLTNLITRNYDNKATYERKGMFGISAMKRVK